MALYGACRYQGVCSCGLCDKMDSKKPTRPKKKPTKPSLPKVWCFDCMMYTRGYDHVLSHLQEKPKTTP